MLNVDFIQENISYKIDEKDEENIFKIILNPDEESIPVPVENESQSPTVLNKKKNVRPSQNIKMKGFFDCEFCCKSNKSMRNLLSDVADEFLKELVDVKTIILLLAQLKEFKNASLQEYQKIVHERTKIIMKPQEIIKKKKDDMKFQICFDELKRKIKEKKYNAIDLMIIDQC